MADSPTLTPTKRMASAASHGLRLHEKFDRGGTEVDLKRTHQLRDRNAVTTKDVKDMHTFFARHQVDKNPKEHERGSDRDPSAGYIAWLLWGGDAGKDWADRKREQLED